jgi:hypothetical protein
MFADLKLPSQWKSDAHFDYAMGTFGHHEGERWGKERRQGFVHTRRVLFVKPGYFVVLDTVDPPTTDTSEHRYESVFHLDAAQAQIDAETSAVATTDEQRANIVVLPLAAPDLSVRIVQGQKEPELQGWISDHGYELRAVPTAIFTRHCAGPVHTMYVFAPVPPGGSSPVVSVTASRAGKKSSLGADITLPNGKIDHLELRQNGSLELERANGRHFASGP